MNDPLFILGLCSLVAYLLLGAVALYGLYYVGRLAWRGCGDLRSIAQKLSGSPEWN